MCGTPFISTGFQPTIVVSPLAQNSFDSLFWFTLRPTVRLGDVRRDPGPQMPSLIAVSKCECAWTRAGVSLCIQVRLAVESARLIGRRTLRKGYLKRDTTKKTEVLKQKRQRRKIGTLGADL